MSELTTEDILGYPVAHGSTAHCVESVNAWIANGDSGCWLACINPHSYVESLKEPDFAFALREADWLIPDGVGIVLASRILGGEIRERVTGSDIFQGVMQQLNLIEGHNVFFLGATEQTLVTIRERAAREYPNVRVAGTYSPPFKAVYSEVEMKAMVKAINETAPDVLWVGMTAPKQELWLHQNLTKCPTVKFAAAIGAAFDYYAGRVKRPSPVLQQMGLEWLPRLLQEPSRLWRRMFISAPIFLWHLLRARQSQRYNMVNGRALAEQRACRTKCPDMGSPR